MTNIENIPDIMSQSQYAILIQNWNGDSWKVLCEKHIRWAVKIAKRFTNTGMDLDDLIGCALEGLVKAAQNYDPNSSTKFSTYAYYPIRNEILRELNYNKVHPNPTISINQILYSKYDDDPYEMQEYVENPGRFEDEVVMIERLRQVLSKEKKTNQRIFCLYLCGYMQKEIAKMYGISTQRISKIICDIREKI